MKKSILMVVVCGLLIGLGSQAVIAGKTEAPVDKVYVEGRYGEFCTDPQSWVDAGYTVGIWGPSVPFKAQAFDTEGHLVQDTFSFEVIETGETGSMALHDSNNLEYQFKPYVPEGITYNVAVTVGEVTGTGKIYRDPAKCDACHSTPPGHIADSANWGKCHDCHNLGVVMHKHAYNKAGLIDQCYTCHPTGCLDDDIHKAEYNMWCTDCHGDLSQTATGTFKISGMAGKPYCADCHDSKHAEYQPKKGERELFCESNGHGKSNGARGACISCHGAPHRVKRPSFDVGLNNNCSGCHTTQASDGNMGSDCANCHEHQWDPHLVVK